MAIRTWNKQEESVRKRLRDYRSLVSKHQACKDLMDSLYPSMVQNITDMPKGGGIDNKMECLIDRRINLQRQMQNSLDDMRAEIDSVIDLIKPLPPREYSVVNRYFLLGEDMDTVASRLDISARHCWTIHNRAISKLSDSVH